MRRSHLVFVILLTLCSAYVNAQQPDPKEINLIAGNLATQRNDAQNSAAVLQAKLQLAEEKIKQLEQEVKQYKELKGDKNEQQNPSGHKP